MAEVYCVKLWKEVTNEGIEEHVFEINKTEADTGSSGADTEESLPIDSTSLRSGKHYNGIDMVRSQGLIWTTIMSPRQKISQMEPRLNQVI